MLDQSKNFGAIDVKMDGSILREKSSFKMLGLTFSSKLDRGSHIMSIAKPASKKIGVLICFMKFFSLRLLCVTINLPYGHAWHSVVISRLLLLVATWNCWISYMDIQDCLSFTWVIVKNVASLSLFYRYYFRRCSFELA